MEISDSRRPRRSMQERAERSVNIGDDSLPGPWNLGGPSAPNRGNPIKTGGLTDSCSEPFSSGLIFISRAFGGRLNALDFPPIAPGQAVFINEADTTTLNFS